MSKRLTIEEFIETLKQGGSGSGGSSGGALIVNCSWNSDLEGNMLDKTWGTINDALRSGSIVLVLDDYGAYLATTSYKQSNVPPCTCRVFGYTSGASASTVFYANSEEDYPVYYPD